MSKCLSSINHSGNRKKREKWREEEEERRKRRLVRVLIKRTHDHEIYGAAVIP